MLAGWAPGDADSPGMEFAERVSQWLGAFDAMALQSALQAVRAVDGPASSKGPARAAARAATVTTLAQSIEQVRGVLAKAIDQPVAAADEGAAIFPAYRDRHLELQRQMALLIAPLRAHVRDTASRRSARLRQLAMLDASMEQVLAGREHTLLAKLPGLLKRRFEQLRASARDADDNNEWLQTFGREWRQALLAEAEVRLAPACGLAEAAANEWDDTR